MPEEEVRYRLTLDDLLSGKLTNADTAAKGLESSMQRVTERIVEYAAVYGSIEFFKSAYEEHEKLIQAQGQLEQTLKNVGSRAGLTADDLKEMAKAGVEGSEFTKEQFTNAEGVLVRFSNLSKTTFKEAVGMAADLAQATKTGVDETARSLGRILEAPAENARLLRQFNISLTESQRKQLAAWEHSGQIAKAQGFIFDELAQKGYAGAAGVAASLDPLHDVSVQMEELKDDIGEGLTEGINELKPALLWLIQHADDLVHWIEDNETEIKELVIGVVAAYTAFKVWTLAIVPLAEGLAATEVAGEGAAVGIEATTTAVEAASGPVGLLALALGGLAAAYMHVADARDKYLNGATDDENDIAEQDFDKYTKQGLNEKDAYEKALKEDQDDLDNRKKTAQQSLQQSIDEHNADAKKTLDMGGSGTYYDPNDLSGMGTDDNIEYWKKELDVIGADQKGLDKFKTKHQASVSAGSGKLALMPTGDTTQKSEGPKVVNVNVTIGNLIDKFAIETTNIMQSPDQIKKMVAMALTDAVNDAEILVGQQH